MQSELRELLDTSIMRANLNKFEILKLEKSFKNISFIEEFLENVYADIDDIVCFDIKQFSYKYFLHYLTKEQEKQKILKAKKMLDSKDSLVEFAKSIYEDSESQILFIAQYL